jgi:hypothetical protein
LKTCVDYSSKHNAVVAKVASQHAKLAKNITRMDKNTLLAMLEADDASESA